MRRSRVVTGGLAAATLLVVATPALGASAASAATPTGTTSASGAVDQKVIVVLKNQLSATPATKAKAAARNSAARQTQAPVLARAKASGAKDVKTYTTIDAFSATVSSAEKQSLQSDPSVAEVVPDGSVHLADTQTAASSAAAAAATPAACASSNGIGQLPQYLGVTNTQSDNPSAKTARSLGFDGSGVKVAYIAEGIDINNPDFIRKDGSHVFVDYQDFSADGPNAPTSGGEAFLDASSIAAQGTVQHDVSKFSGLPVTGPCNVRTVGIAPGASLVGLKVFANDNYTTESDFLEAIDYAVFHDHVDVLNESFGSDPFPDSFNDVTKIFDEQAVAAGTTVTTSSGDAGYTSTIGSPASDPDVISVGASTTFKGDVIIGLGTFRLSTITGWLNDNISSLSSGGTTEAGRTVDLVAPGDLDWTTCTANTKLYEDCVNDVGLPSNVGLEGGTSMSAPLTAGAAALVIQAYRSAHGGASPTPAQVKQILVSSADDISAPADQQGAGRLDTYRAVQLALTTAAPTVKPAAGTGGLLVSDGDADGGDQITLAGAPKTAQSRTVTVTNTGDAPATVDSAARTLGAYSTVLEKTVTLGDNVGTHPVDWGGHVDNVQTLTFTVPASVSRLDASIANPGDGDSANLSERTRITLVDPNHNLAGYSLPQGSGNYGDTQVANPAAGTWTAIISSRGSSTGGYVGAVHFQARTAAYSTSYTKPVVIASGGSYSFPVKGTTPATPGDKASSIVLESKVGSTTTKTTIPVILRSVLQVTKKSQTFTDTLRGGNGRATFTGQTFYYQLNVPAGLAEINASVLLSKDPTSTFTATLSNAHGDTVAVGGNLLSGTDNDGALSTTSQLGGAIHYLAPPAGLYDLSVNFYNSVSGDSLTTPFSVTVDGTPVAATATGLPTSSDELAPGDATTVAVKVHNTTTATEQYFTDARLATTVDLPLAVTSATTALPLDAFPTWITPTDTTALTVTSKASLPVTFDYGPNAAADPDLGANTQGTTAVGRYVSDTVPAGQWFSAPTELGPFPAGGAPAGTQTTTVTATTAAFDTNVTSSTGDLWQQAYDPTATVTPVDVPAGGTATIYVTVAADENATPGSTVSGTIYLNDMSLLNQDYITYQGEQIAAFPYSYTVASPDATPTTSSAKAGGAKSGSKTGSPAVKQEKAVKA